MRPSLARCSSAASATREANIKPASMRREMRKIRQEDEQETAGSRRTTVVWWPGPPPRPTSPDQAIFLLAPDFLGATASLAVFRLREIGQGFTTADEGDEDELPSPPSRPASRSG